jgi:Periplasmic binding protein
MSAPVSDDESPEYQKYAPKRLREQQPQFHPSSQDGVASPPMSPSHAQIQGRRAETSGLPSSGGDLENEVPRRLYEPEPLSQPSAPVSDDESPEYQKYAPKRLREQQPQLHPSSQSRVASPPMSPSHAQIQGRRTETSGLPSSGGDLENEVPRRLYDPEPLSQPSAPVSDDESPEYQKYAPKRLREQQPQLHPSSQSRVASPPMSPSHAQIQGRRTETSVSPFSGGGLENEVRRRPYEPELVSQQPDLRRRGYSVLRLISWLAIVAACAGLIVIIAIITKPLWPGLGTQPPLQASRPSDSLATNNATDPVTGIAATSGAQQPSSVQAQPAQLAPFARQFEQKSIDSPVQGVTENEIRFGISAPFSGAAKELGQNMKLGIQAAFNVANTNGGVNGRQLRLVAVDDGYEPTRTAETMKQLYEQDRVFAIVGNVGTPTATVALPYALERRMLFYGAFTGASLLRSDPPDRYVFNYRASYAEETDAVVRYLVKVRRLKSEQIAVFAQQDSYGDAGFAGVAKAMRSLRGGDENTILRLPVTLRLIHPPA